MKRVVIVGASTGLGRCLGKGLAERGLQVTIMGRRQEKLDEAAGEVDAHIHTIRCDATDQRSCTEAFAAAAEAMGGIDTVIYAAASGPLTKIKDSTTEQWQDAFATNVIGAVNATQAALPYVSESIGNVLFMSTTGASYTAPWPGLAVYQVTKAALDRSVEAWRAEQPGVNFMRVTIGECPGGEGDNQTQFTDGWDPDLAGEVGVEWFNRQLLSGSFIDVEHLIDTFKALIEAGNTMQMPSLTILPRPPIPAT